MEKEFAKIHRRLHRSKFAIYIIIAFLALLTYLLIIVSGQISNDQAIQNQSQATYEIQDGDVVDVEFPLDLSEINRPMAIFSPTPTPWLFATPPLPTQRPKVTVSPEKGYACGNEFSPKYPCVFGYNAHDPASWPPECFKYFRPKCRVFSRDDEGIIWTNTEDTSPKPIPDRYKAYCKYLPGKGTECQFPDKMCIVINMCYEEQWQFMAEICGCYRPPAIRIVTQSPAIPVDPLPTFSQE